MGEHIPHLRLIQKTKLITNHYLLKEQILLRTIKNQEDKLAIIIKKKRKNVY